MSDDALLRFGLRISPDLHHRLVEAAGQTNRSLNAEMLARLQSSFEAPDFAAVLRALLGLGDRLNSIEARLANIERAFVSSAGLEDDVPPAEYLRLYDLPLPKARRKKP